MAQLYGQEAEYLGKRKAATPGYEVHMYRTGKHSTEDVITREGSRPPHRQTNLPEGIKAAEKGR